MQLNTATPGPDSDSLTRDARAFYVALSRLVRAYQFRDRQRLCYHGISVTQCYALGALIRSGPMRLDALASQLYLDKSTASRAIDGLEAAGYVRRAPEPEDGRALSLQPTAKGIGLNARIERDLIREQAQLIAAFSPKVRAASTKLIHRAAEQAEGKFQCRDGSDR